MKKWILYSFLVLLLLGCESGSSLSSPAFSSNSEFSETNTSTISSSSSVASVTGNLENKWFISLGLTRSSYNQIKPTIPTSLSSRGVIDMVHIQTIEDNSLVGFSFESRVRGSGGNFTFRIGILNQKFGGFQTVSESEHGPFGDRVFSALRAGLAGKDATYENVLLTYVQQSLNINTAEVTETLENMMPSIAAMLDYYDSFNVE